MKGLCLPLCLATALAMFVSQAWAAPVTLVSDPGAYDAPTAAELTGGTSLIGSIPNIPPGGIVTGMRNAPATVINAGLDATAPPLTLDYQNTELGVLPLPTVTDTCPGNTPVTITISQWTAEQTARTLPGTGGMGVGTTMFDSRNPLITEPVSTALVSSPSDLEMPGPHIAPSASYVATFADLPFYTFGTGVEVARVVEVAMTLQVAQAAYNIDPPSITLEYDNANCTAAAISATPVPALGTLQMMLLYAAVMVAGLLFLRRRRPARHRH